jgi:crotonobetainyl-CoA:carnitine CoA-transferase CaiB-like acyl-CoA transferase
LVGHPEVIAETWFAEGAKRAQHADQLDAMVGEWIAERPFHEVVAAFEEAQAAVAPIYDIRQIIEDPQYRALGSIVSIEDPDLGPLKMQNVMFRLSETPGEIRWAGRRLGEDNEAVYGELLGLDRTRIAELAAKEVI